MASHFLAIETKFNEAGYSMKPIFCTIKEKKVTKKITVCEKKVEKTNTGTITKPGHESTFFLIFYSYFLIFSPHLSQVVL